MNLIVAAWARSATDVRLAVFAGLAAIAWCLLTLDPLGPATIDPDASSSVLYFETIMSFQPLEAFVPTTPKPLLTVAYGVAWLLNGDWRQLVWLTILFFGVGVGAVAVFIVRLLERVKRDGVRDSTSAPTTTAAVGGVAFATAALLASSDMMLEVSRANSLVWALACWSVAGVAICSTPVRPRVAGVALLGAGLCRFETLALVAVAALAVVLTARRADRRSTPSAGRTPIPIMADMGDLAEARSAPTGELRANGAVIGVAVALTALPLAMLHDWLLTGDPLYWLSVPGRYTAIFNPGLQVIEPFAYAGTLIGRLAPRWPLILLGVVGVAVLVRTRQWLPLAGIAAIPLGVVALLFGLAAKATYISNRYYEPIDLGLILAVAVGVGWLVEQVLGNCARNVAVVSAALVALILGMGVMWPAFPWDRRATTELANVRTSSANMALALPVIRRFAVPFAGSSSPCRRNVHDDGPYLFVPSRDVARVIVETGACTLDVGNSYATLLNRGVAALRPGQVVFHDAAADRPVGLYRPLEVEASATVDGVVIQRLPLHIPGTWLLRVR